MSTTKEPALLIPDFEKSARLLVSVELAELAQRGYRPRDCTGKLNVLRSNAREKLSSIATDDCRGDS